MAPRIPSDCKVLRRPPTVRRQPKPSARGTTNLKAVVDGAPTLPEPPAKTVTTAKTRRARPCADVAAAGRRRGQARGRARDLSAVKTFGVWKEVDDFVRANGTQALAAQSQAQVTELKRCSRRIRATRRSCICSTA